VGLDLAGEIVVWPSHAEEVQQTLDKPTHGATL
jgi:hypothetical protein